MMKTKFVALTVALAMVSTARAVSRNGYNSFSFGNSQAGAMGSYSITAENGGGCAKTSINANGSVSFLNRTARGVDFTATVQNCNGQKTSIWNLQVAGYTVDSGARTVSYTWTKSINQTLVSASLPIMVGPVPVTLSGSVGGGAAVGYSFGLGTTSVSLSGSGAAWANGSASAGVGVPLLSLALRSSLQLANTSLNPYVNVTTTGMSGGAQLVFNPVQIDLAVTLLSMSHVWYQYTLASYSAPSRTLQLLTL